MLNLNDLRTTVVGECRTAFSVLSGDRNAARTILLIQRWLLANLPRRSGKGVLNLKDLLAVSPPSGARPFRSCGATQTWRGPSIDSRRVVGEVSEENGRSAAQSKGLANGVSGEP